MNTPPLQMDLTMLVTTRRFIRIKVKATCTKHDMVTADLREQCWYSG